MRQIPLLSRERPMDIIHQGIERYQEKVFELDPKSKNFATGVRNLVLLHVATQTGFRRKTFVQLTYNDEQTGDLRNVEGNWHLEVSKEKFKNRSAEHVVLAGAYRLKLNNQFGAYAAFEAYAACRSKILLGRKSDKLLVTNGQNLEYNLKRSSAYSWNDPSRDGIRFSFYCRCSRSKNNSDG